MAPSQPGEEDPSSLSAAQPPFQISTDDYLHGESGLGKQAEAFAPTCKWHFRNIILPKQAGKLYWYLDSPCNDGIDVRVAIRLAFAIWQPWVPFTFTEATKAASANIVIKFINDPNAPLATGPSPWWQGSWVTIGWGYAPYEALQGLGCDYRGDIFINDCYVNWKNNPPQLSNPSGQTWPANFTLVPILAHEMGHALGLDHDATSSKNLMSPQGPQTGNGQLYDGDITSITRLYVAPYHLVFGQEHVTKLIADAFQKVLGRIPTSTEKQSWSTKLMFNRLPSKTANSYSKFLVALAALDETWKKANSTSSTWVTNQYKALLNRAPTAAEMSDLTTKMKNGQTRTQIATAIIASDAWRQAFVKSVWQAQLQTTISATDLNTIVTAMKSGKDAMQVIYECDTIAAYFNICAPKSNSGLITRLFTTLTGVKPNTTQYNYWMTWID
jgi:hypothetical protein